jgi:hypothetical protein
MTTKRALIMVLAVLILIGPIWAASPRMLVNVPFEFKVGPTSLPAGAYWVGMDRSSTAAALGSVVSFSTPEAGVLHRTIGHPASKPSSAASRLVFSRYGDTYFLTTVEVDGILSRAPKSRAEKELAAKLARPGQSLAVPAR